MISKKRKSDEVCWLVWNENDWSESYRVCGRGKKDSTANTSIVRVTCPDCLNVVGQVSVVYRDGIAYLEKE